MKTLASRSWFRPPYGGRRWWRAAGFATGKRPSICFAAKTATRRSSARWRSARVGRAAARKTWRRPRWVETRLAEVVTLDCLGRELDEEPLEVHWIRRPANEKIRFEHKFKPAEKMPPPSR